MNRLDPEVVEKILSQRSQMPSFLAGGLGRASVLVVHLAPEAFPEHEEGWQELQSHLAACVTIVTEEVYAVHGSVESAVGLMLQSVLPADSPEGSPGSALRIAASAMDRAAQVFPAEAPSALRVSAGLATGAGFTGCFGAEYRMFCGTIGAAVERARLLCEAAAPGELLLDEESLSAAGSLPPDLLAALRPREPADGGPGGYSYRAGPLTPR